MSVDLNSNKTLFVFYTLSSTKCFWTYKNFPNGWEINCCF